MTILDEIVIHKKKVVAERLISNPIKELEKSIYFKAEKVSLKEYILREDKSGIIAEFKRQSPSKGIINGTAKVKDVTTGYAAAGASALSILTDTKFFGGKNEDVTNGRKFNTCPILRKDFIIDEYQIIEAKSIGADVILLIAAILTKEEIKHFAQFAFNLGLEVLLEIHTQEELLKYDSIIQLVGINNRNLKTFEVDFKNSIKLSQQLPAETVKIAESGISNIDNIIELKNKGFDGFLIGENFMKTNNPGLACKEFIEQINLGTNA